MPEAGAPDRGIAPLQRNTDAQPGLNDAHAVKPYPNSNVGVYQPRRRAPARGLAALTT